MKTFVLIFVVALGLGLQAKAQLKDENLVVTMPPGFKVATQSVRDKVVFQEWIPASETVENWSEMVTTQILLGRPDIDGAKYLTLIEQGWLRACKESKPNPVVSGTSNGYALWTLMLQCPLLASTGKPETTLFRSIRGNDSFYSVQRAMRAIPDRAQMAKMASYLETVVVCDSRRPDRPCPDLKAQGFRPAK